MINRPRSKDSYVKAGVFRTLTIHALTYYYTALNSLKISFKRYFSNPTRLWTDQVIANWANKLLKLIDVTCTVNNPLQVEPKPGQATIIMCNHSSLYDIPLSYKAFPHSSIRMLSKIEMSKIPFMGKGMRAAEFPFIDRKNRAQAAKDLDKVRELLKSGIVMWIAPEGTRSKDGKLAPFKKGGIITAIQAKATIIPMGIQGASDILPNKTLRPYLGVNTVINIGKPIDASKYTMDDRNVLLEEVFQAIKQLLEQ